MQRFRCIAPAWLFVEGAVGIGDWGLGGGGIWQPGQHALFGGECGCPVWLKMMASATADNCRNTHKDLRLVISLRQAGMVPDKLFFPTPLQSKSPGRISRCQEQAARSTLQLGAHCHWARPPSCSRQQDSPCPTCSSALPDKQSGPVVHSS
jgi:hypothetical protein